MLGGRGGGGAAMPRVSGRTPQVLGEHGGGGGAAVPQVSGRTRQVLGGRGVGGAAMQHVSGRTPLGLRGRGVGGEPAAALGTGEFVLGRFLLVDLLFGLLSFLLVDPGCSVAHCWIGTLIRCSVWGTLWTVPELGA